MDILRECSDIIDVNKHRKKPPIPKLPETIAELNKLLDRQFGILSESRVLSGLGGEYRPGGVAVVELEMECPFCGMRFKGVRGSGCFTCGIFPFACPNCHFPENVFSVLTKRLKEKEVLMPGKEK